MSAAPAAAAGNDGPGIVFEETAESCVVGVEGDTDVAAGTVVIGDEWPENNRAPPAHNPVHSTGPAGSAVDDSSPQRRVYYVSQVQILTFKLAGLFVDICSSFSKSCVCTSSPPRQKQPQKKKKIFFGLRFVFQKWVRASM